MTDALEFHPVADIFPMMSEQEFADITADIAENGLREPVWLHRDGRIIDGRNRYLACRESGQSMSFRTYEGDDEKLVAFVVSLNLHRRHFDESQRSMVTARIANLRRGRPVDNQANLPLSRAAELLNVSERSAKSARKVHESPVGELADLVEARQLSVSAAAEIARAPEDEQRRVVSLDDRERILAEAKRIKRERIEQARSRQPEPVTELMALPGGKFSCIVVDPPWPVQKIEREERPDQGAALDYPAMPVECQRPHVDHADNPCQSIECVVGSTLATVSGDDCHLYLWVTHKYLPDGLRLLKQWGFRYQCVMTWRKNVGITPFSWMYDTEHVLFGRRGNLKLARLGLRLSFDAPTQGHSVKPDIFYDRVRDASPGPRLEMFPGVEHDGFEPWGLEASHRAG